MPSSSDESELKVRQCPACPYTTTRLYLYERHMKVHSAEESKGGPNLFICSQVCTTHHFKLTLTV